MANTHVYTSFTFSYLQRARILAQTLRVAHPNWIFWALLTDEPPDGFDMAPCRHEFDHIMYSTELGIGQFRSWIFKHDIVEACTAVKGKMLMHILEAGADKVIYLDPDIAVFHPLDEIEKKLDDVSIILTPHQCVPNTDPIAIRDNEMTTLQYGVYNLGFAAIRNDDSGRHFASWWADRLHDACYDEPERGIFTDQKYCDMVPGLFSNVYIERDPGYNVASWNLSSRRFSIRRDGGIYVNNSPLRFYHFTKINSVGDAMTERYAEDAFEVYEVWNWYKRQIIINELPGLPKGWWIYNSFADGTKIPKKVREFYRRSNDLMERFRNPFASGPNSFQEHLLSEHPTLLAK